MCYYYYKRSRSNSYYCAVCHSKGATVNGSMERDEIGRDFFWMKDQHIALCQLSVFKLTFYDFEVIKSSDYKIEKTKHGNDVLVIFAQDRQSCYRMSAEHNVFVCRRCRELKKRVTVRKHQQEDGKEVIHLFGKHLCKPKSCSWKDSISIWLKSILIYLFFCNFFVVSSNFDFLYCFVFLWLYFANINSLNLDFEYFFQY